MTETLAPPVPVELLHQMFNEELPCIALLYLTNSRCGKPATWEWIWDNRCEHVEPTYLCDQHNQSLGGKYKDEYWNCRVCGADFRVIERKRIK